MIFTSDCAIQSALDIAAAASADRNGEACDTQGYTDVTAVVKFGTIADGATTAVKLQYCDTSGGTYEDMTGASIDVAADDDNQVFVLHAHRPQKRYVRVVVDKDAANNTEETALYIKSNPTEMPVTFDVTDAVTNVTVYGV